MDNPTDELASLAVRIREAIARRDPRTAHALMAERLRLALSIAKARARGERAERFDRRAERRAQREAWPKCGAPRADGKPCEARAVWLTGEDAPRTRCRHHGGAQSPNVPRIRPTRGTERP